MMDFKQNQYSLHLDLLMPSIKSSTLLLDNLKNLLSVICNLHFAYVILELVSQTKHACPFKFSANIRHKTKFRLI